MKFSVVLLAVAAVAGTSFAHAQSIKVSQAATPAALTPSTQPDATAQSVAIYRATAPNWARVVGSRGADGTLTARCIVEPNPEVAAANKSVGKTTTRKHKK